MSYASQVFLPTIVFIQNLYKVYIYCYRDIHRNFGNVIFWAEDKIVMDEIVAGKNTQFVFTYNVALLFTDILMHHDVIAFSRTKQKLVSILCLVCARKIYTSLK